MRIADMNWQQVEAYLQRDDRAVLPLGCTEQHAYLSLATDSILAERVAVEAAEPLSIPVFPVLAYGVTPSFRAYPGTVSIRMETYLKVVREILDGLYGSGFRRILIVNGHGGNSFAQTLVHEWLPEHPGARVQFHNWWNAPETSRKVAEIDPLASHASWMENFPWTRLPGVTMPAEQKPMVDLSRLRTLAPPEVRAELAEGNYGGLFLRSDEEMLAIWQVAVAETRRLLEAGW